MRTYQSSNQHKQIKYNERAAQLFSSIEKIYNIYDTNNYKNGKNGKMPHLFSIKHIFLEVLTASLSIQKKERNKKFEFEQSFWRNKIR